MSVRVRVPASTANLGPGFDTFALALCLHNEFEALLSDDWHVEIGGEGAATLPADAGNPVARAMARLFEEIERNELRAEIYCHNGIPVGKGLGSSASAIVGGLILANTLVGKPLSSRRLFELAAELDGHADNVSAAMHGGFTITVRLPDGMRHAHINPARGLAAVVVMGEEELPTATSRAVLPAQVAHEAAAANAGNAALVAVGLALGDHTSLTAGLADVLHEPFRRQLVPDFDAVREALEAIGAGPAVLSGAGPTMISFIHGTDDEDALSHARAFAERARSLLSEIGRGRVIALGIDRNGATQL